MSAVTATRIDVDGVGQTGRIALLELVALGLARSPFARPRFWSIAVVIVRREQKRTTTRADFAQWARANDLADVATCCTRTRTRPGEILAWLEIDVPDVSAAGFVVVPLAKLLAGSR